jgi:cupin superfamily acireductone dioxygenase involved in methionine salvage
MGTRKKLKTETVERDSKGRFVRSPTSTAKSRNRRKKFEPVTNLSTQLVNRFVVCLDRSGSMQGIRNSAVAAFNQNVNAIRSGAKSSNQSSSVSLITFGDDVREEYFNQDVASLRDLDQYSYYPSGGTPLLDAVGLAIERLRSLPDSKDTSYVVLVVTDGEENTSRRYNASSLAKLMQEVVATDRWSFAFLVPPGKKQALVAQYGIPEGNVSEWEATSAGMAKAAASVNQGLHSYYATRASGLKSTKSFFTTDLSKVTTTQVQRNLNDIRNNVYVWNVDGECEVRTFVEGRGYTYEKGRAFYQLTKEEIVQGYKQILLIEKGKGAVYSGDDARYLLNLPNYEVKVRPGNHSNWDVFVQSTSTNRKLVRGTKLVYLK